MRFVIIGGSDAGISAALRARELDSSLQITVLLAGAFPNYSMCGLPFYLSGETPDWHQFAHRTEFEGIELMTNHTAQAFDPSKKTVSATDAVGKEKTISYDRLLIATGARPVIPPIQGTDLPGVYPLHTIIEESGELRVYASGELNVSAHLVLIAVGVQPKREHREEGGSSNRSKRCASRGPSHGNRYSRCLCGLDLGYTPPFSSPWDPVQMAAQTWSRAAA